MLRSSIDLRVTTVIDVGSSRSSVSVRNEVATSALYTSGRSAEMTTLGRVRAGADVESSAVCAEASAEATALATPMSRAAEFRGKPVMTISLDTSASGANGNANRNDSYLSLQSLAAPRKAQVGTRERGRESG